MCVRFRSRVASDGVNIKLCQLPTHKTTHKLAISSLRSIKHLLADRKRTISQIQHNRFYCSTVLLCGGGEKFEHINPKNQTNIDTDQQCVWYESIAISEANGYSGIYIIIVPNTGYVVEFFGTQL